MILIDDFCTRVVQLLNTEYYLFGLVSVVVFNTEITLTNIIYITAVTMRFEKKSGVVQHVPYYSFLTLIVFRGSRFFNFNICGDLYHFNVISLVLIGFCCSGFATKSNKKISEKSPSILLWLRLVLLWQITGTWLSLHVSLSKRNAKFIFMSNIYDL